MIVRYNTHIVWDGMFVDAKTEQTASGFRMTFEQSDEFGNKMDVSIEFDKIDIQQIKNRDLFNDPLI